MVTLNINNLLEESGQSQYWLSKQTGIDQHNIKNLCVGNPVSIQLSTIDKVCNALNCEISDIFTRSNENDTVK